VPRCRQKAREIKKAAGGVVEFRKEFSLDLFCGFFFRPNSFKTPSSRDISHTFFPSFLEEFSHYELEKPLFEKTTIKQNKNGKEQQNKPSTTPSKKSKKKRKKKKSLFLRDNLPLGAQQAKGLEKERVLERDLGESVEASRLGEVARAQVALEEDGPTGAGELAEAGDPLKESF